MCLWGREERGEGGSLPVSEDENYGDSCRKEIPAAIRINRGGVESTAGARRVYAQRAGEGGGGSI